jgi:hypothetical protein
MQQQQHEAVHEDYNEVAAANWCSEKGCIKTEALMHSFLISTALQQLSDLIKIMVVYYVTQQLMAAAVISAGQQPTNCHPHSSASWVFRRLLPSKASCCNKCELPVSKAYFTKAANQAGATGNHSAEEHPSQAAVELTSVGTSGT